MANDYKAIINDKKLEAGELMTEDQMIKVNALIHSAAVASGVSGFIPVPVADAVPISMAQIGMIIGLGKVFDQELTESAAKGIVGAAASTFVGRNLVKMIPFVGWFVSAGVAAGVTEAIGWMAAVDMAKKFRSEWKSQKNAKEAADNYATAEYYKKSPEGSDACEEAEDFT